MNFTIGSINWPADHREAICLYLKYIIKTLEELHIAFSNDSRDPIEIAKGYINGAITGDMCRAESVRWWEIVDTEDSIRDFQNPRILMARMAICLLSIDENDTLSLGEDLSWFIELLDSMNADTDRAITIMIDHFTSHTN